MKANGGKLPKTGSSHPSSVWLPVPLQGHRQRGSSERRSARARTCSSMARSPASGRHTTRAAACGDHAASRAVAGAVTGRMSRSPAEASPPRRRSALRLPGRRRDRLAPAASVWVVRQPG